MFQNKIIVNGQKDGQKDKMDKTFVLKKIYSLKRLE